VREAASKAKRPGRTARRLITPAILIAGATGFGLAGLGVTAADAATSTGAAAQVAPASAARPDAWVSGGSYPTLADCQASGSEAISQGYYNQYRCDVVTYPDGQINYYQLWLE
jgi:hypothetical protein